MNISSIRIGAIALVIAFGVSCKKEVTKQYAIDEVELYTSASEKKNLKTDEQFISILYSDLFGTAITNTKLQELNQAYTSMGDKVLVIDILIKSMLADPSAEVPTKAAMDAQPANFVKTAYKTLLVRNPTRQEEWFLVNQIEKNKVLEPIDIYYAILTSDEYRYY